MDGNDSCIKALRAFISTIENTGGLQADHCPVGDPEWGDLGEAYLAACAALGRTPLVAAEEDAQDEDDVDVALAAIMEATGTEEHEWSVSDGPTTGVGDERYYVHRDGTVYYTCVDQGEVIACSPA